jgi:pyrimidine-nucleoside phosphorylase
LHFDTNLTADIPSTGGPSSLSTIIGPLLLKENYIVPKLGIVGRPAGGIDVLSQIEGYNIKLSSQAIYSILEKTNYCHFISNNEYAPLDSILFKYRSENNFKNISSLVISSLLSKKIAVGVKNICLDVRYSDFGNFGKSLLDAQKLSIDFKSVADVLGICCEFYFSDNNILMQPYIGRGESLLAILEYINGNANIWLTSHIQDCKKMAEKVLKKNIKDEKLRDIISRNFVENIKIQGGSYDSFVKVAEKIRWSHIHEIRAQTNGKLYINIERLRNLIVDIQKKHISADNEFPDPCGIIFYKNQSDYVLKEDLILTYRALKKDIELFQNSLNKIIKVNN